jgi:hypothetical protein
MGKHRRYTEIGILQGKVETANIFVKMRAQILIIIKARTSKLNELIRKHHGIYRPVWAKG